MANVQDVILKIQKEAKRKVAAGGKRFSIAAKIADKKSVAKKVDTKATVAVTKEAVAPTKADITKDIIEKLKDQVSTAVTKAISTKAARLYVGNIDESLYNIANENIIKHTVNYANNGGETTIYPNNCKLLVLQEDIQGNNDARGVLLIEEPPQTRTIFATDNNYRNVNYRIHLPYMVFAIGFIKRTREKKTSYLYSRCGVGFRKEPIKSIDDTLFYPHLPHATGNTHVCQPVNVITYQTIKELADNVIYTFWNSVFQYSFSESGCSFTLEEKRIRSFSEWEKIKNPLDILKGQFKPGLNLVSVLNEIGQIKENGSLKFRSAVNNLISDISERISADELADVIQETAENIVNAAIKDFDLHH